MKNYFRTITAIAFLAVASCQKNTEFNTEQNTAIKKAVENQYMKLVSTLNHLDFNALSENFSKDGFNSAIIGEKFLSSYNVWKDSVSNWLSQRERQQIKLVEISVRLLTAELALMTSTTDWDIPVRLRLGLSRNIHPGFACLYNAYFYEDRPSLSA